MAKKPTNLERELRMERQRIWQLETMLKELSDIKRVSANQDQMSASINILQSQVNELRDELDRMRKRNPTEWPFLTFDPETKRESTLRRWLSGQW